MSIQFSGLGSGIDYASWVDQLVAVKAKQLEPLDDKLIKLKNSNAALGVVKTNFENFKNALQAFTNVVSGTTNDIYSKKATTSSMFDCLTASATNRATIGSYTVSIIQLATPTITKSAGSVGEAINPSTKFTDIRGAEKGTFSLIVGGVEKTIEIEANDTLQDVADKINALGGVTASIDANGNFALSTADTNSFSVGLATDTSNFRSVMKLTRQPDENGEKIFANQGVISLVNTNVSLVSGDARLALPINQGTFKINGEEFEIADTTSINDIVYKINTNKNVGVQAAFDANTGTFTLTSATTGGIGISMQDNGTGFFAAMGLSNNENSTTLGRDAIVEINGTRVTSSSNTITNTGYDGLTLNLTKVPKDNEIIKINVNQDMSEVRTAIQMLVATYNATVNQIQEAVKRGGYLETDMNLRSICDEFRRITASMLSDSGDFNMLAQIGITTGKASSTLSSDIMTLKIDHEMLDEALKNNAQGIKDLFSNSNSTGVADLLLKKVNDSLALDIGYFATRADTLQKQIKLQDDRITKGIADLDVYRTRLTRQFRLMDETIGKLNAQLARLQSSGLISS